MTRRHESDSTDNGGSTDTVPHDDEGQSPQSPQQASSGDWRVGQVREGVRQPSPDDVMRAMTLAALGGHIGIGSGPQGVEIFASPVARKIINGADSVSGMEPAPSVWLGDIPPAE